MKKHVRHPRLAWALSLLVASAAVGCGSAPPNYNYSKEFDPRKHEYIVGPSDTMSINVWGNPDLGGNALVRPDGTITLPLIGDLQVDGSTPSQIRAEISQRLSAYVKDENAHVTVAVTGVNSYNFTVSGSVSRPGIFTSRYYVTVAEAVAMAGGPTRFAESDQAVIIRTDAQGKTRQIPINYDLIAEGENKQMDLALVRGDTVFIP